MKRAIARAAAWLAFMTGLIAGGGVVDLESFAIGAAIGAAFVLLGFAAAWRVRTLRRDTSSRARLAAMALAVGRWPAMPRSTPLISWSSVSSFELRASDGIMSRLPTSELAGTGLVRMTVESDS